MSVVFKKTPEGDAADTVAGDALGDVAGDSHIEHVPLRSKPEPVVEELFSRHNDALVAFLRARLGSNEEAREVAQEAYVKLLQLDQPDAISHLKAYLFRVAANLSIDRVRRRQTANRYQSLAFFEEAGITAEEAAIQREKIQKISQYIQELPPKCRQVFLLSRYSGLNTKAIASQTRLSERSVRNYILRAVTYCQGRLAEDMGGLDD